MINLTQSAPAWAPVYSSGLMTGLTSPTYGGPVLASYTILTTGLYRIFADIYPTTNNSSAWVVDVTARYQQASAAQTEFTVIGQKQMQAGNPGNTSLVPAPPAIVWLTAGAVINFDTKTDSGTKTNGVYSVAIVVERLI